MVGYLFQGSALVVGARGMDSDSDINLELSTS